MKQETIKSDTSLQEDSTEQTSENVAVVMHSELEGETELVTSSNALPFIKKCY